MPRLLFDFPGPDGQPTDRVVLSDPAEVIAATRVEDVLPALRRIEEAVARGLTAAGYISYEAAPAFEPRMRVRADPRMPLLWFALFEESPSTSPTTSPTTPTKGEAGGPDWTIALDEVGHAAAITQVRDHIATGRAYQVNLTTRLRAPFTGDPLVLYESMRQAQGPGYHAFLDLGRFAIASASPELFFATRGREITTRPMKGTRPRGRWLEEDHALAAQLRTSDKDRAENLMIVDLLRNDLSRVATPGSVHVPKLFEIERFRTVWQMTSTVTATLRDRVTLRDILGALFPCGSVTGAPKISTMDIIADLERSPREVYCGAIGLIRPGGDCTFSVPIRTAWIDREEATAEYGAGGGVVWESTAEREYDELLAKAVVVREPWPSFALIETFRLEQGALIRLDRHLARIRDSAEYFGFRWHDAEVRTALARVREEAAPDNARVRVRLILERDGALTVQSEPLVGPIQGSGDRPLPVALARDTVSSTDRFLYHKTTHRAAFDRALADAPAGVWDVLLRNGAGELTELTRANLVVELDGELWTPTREAGVLAGCLRAELLEGGVIREATLRPGDLERATRMWSISSLRGWLELRLI